MCVCVWWGGVMSEFVWGWREGVRDKCVRGECA